MTTADDSIFQPSLAAWAGALGDLGHGKAIGLDEIPAELIHAGGDAFAVRSFGIYENLVKHERWPWRWKGG
eukprot:7353960-Karenia_brevis.AAC.1